MLGRLRVIGVVGLLIAICAAIPKLTHAQQHEVVKTEGGSVQGAFNADRSVFIFKGIPFAAPPVGDLRWKEPHPVVAWPGVRKADKFAPACMQTDVYGDIYFRDSQPSEDCLNLNIWIPPGTAASAKLPVLVWFYGGGFVAGGNSERRYDGENLAKKGIIVVEPNYRLGLFGFFSHPELAKESGHNSSGNYGLLDQAAALRWVVKNIAAFGGDPKNLTIAGESAGSLSVSALMASPLSRNLFQKAMGESGAFFPSERRGGLGMKTCEETEKVGVKFMEEEGAKSLAEMRAKPAQELLEAAAAKHHNGFDFWPNVDGYYLPASVFTIFTEGKQSHVPLLAGWNADENKMSVLMAPVKPTANSFAEDAHKRFGDQADQFLKLYPASSDEEAITSAEALAGDDFIAYATWKWIDMQRKTAKATVYQYRFDQLRPVKPGKMEGSVPAGEAGARHAGEIEYVFETLPSDEGVPWSDGDIKVSEAMAAYWTNFVKTGNPNSNGLPDWPKSDSHNQYQVLHFSDKGIRAMADALRPRYEFLDAQTTKDFPKQDSAAK
jgi:para-nitrobenzyl esterase